MLVYSNGKINILANTRCGSTAIGVFLGLGRHYERINTIDDWIQFSGKKVIILRNPYDRVMSAVRTLNYLEEAEKLTCDAEEFFVRHSCPYLWMIQEQNFSVVLYEDLVKYVPEKDSHQTNTSNVSNETYIINSAYGPECLKYEYLLYKIYKSEREILNVESWNMLCER